MHESNYLIIELFVKHYFNRKQKAKRNLLDFGSQDINGNIRQIINDNNLSYTGLDIVPGPNVDIVTKPGKTLPFEDKSFDYIFSLNCLEHDPFFFKSLLEILRILKDKGIILFSVPMHRNFHREPRDYWRFYPDAPKAIKEYLKLNGYQVILSESFELVDSKTSDLVFIFIKNENIVNQSLICEDIKLKNSVFNISKYPKNVLIKKRFLNPFKVSSILKEKNYLNSVIKKDQKNDKLIKFNLKQDQLIKKLKNNELKHDQLIKKLKNQLLIKDKKIEKIKKNKL